MARTVDWLAKVLYEGMQKSALALGQEYRLDSWDELSAGHQQTFREGLTAALDALGDPPLLKLHEREPIFCLRSQDVVAPHTAIDWRSRAIQAGLSGAGEKFARAGTKIDAMLQWQDEHPELVKVPD